MSEAEDKSYIAHLESEIERLQAENQQFRVEIERLKKEKGLSSAREGLTFNQRTGIYDDDGSHFCPKCLDKEKRNPLRTEEHGWRCTVCDSYYADPDAPPPQMFCVEPTPYQQ